MSVLSRSDLGERFALQYQEAENRRVICGKDIVLHCHHYNSRLQHAMENAANVDGKSIFRSAAAYVFADHIERAFKEDDGTAEHWAVAQHLYAHLGYGLLDFSRVDDDLVTAPTGHFVDGWLSIYGPREQPVCTFAEGYIQGSIKAVTGESVTVREEACMIDDQETCRFRISRNPDPSGIEFTATTFKVTLKAEGDAARSENVDEGAIMKAVVGIPIEGDVDGLIPKFGVYLACTPVDFYNLATFTFIHRMHEQNLHATARNLLTFCGEICGTTTFQGIMSSPEWAALVAPMIKTPADNVFALVAMSRAFGWGTWYVKEQTPAESLDMRSTSGYEALGYRERFGPAADPQCFMLNGVSAGMMELIYSPGTIADRMGTFLSDEKNCICCAEDSCDFEVYPA